MNALIPLHRIMRRGDAEAILHHFKQIEPGIKAAILDPQGQVFVGDDDLEAASQSQQGEAAVTGTAALNDTAVMPITIDAEVICQLVFRGSIRQEAIQGFQFFLQSFFQEAWDRRQLGQETLERYREVNVLYRIGETLGKNLDAAAIPGLLLDETANLVQHDVGVVLSAKNLAMIEARGQSHLANALCQASLALLERVRSTLRPDIERAYIINHREGVVLCAPIKGQDELHGIVALGRTDGQWMFTAGDEKLVMAVTHQAAIAFETSRLHHQEIQHQLLDKELSVGKQNSV